MAVIEIVKILVYWIVQIVMRLGRYVCMRLISGSLGPIFIDRPLGKVVCGVVAWLKHVWLPLVHVWRLGATGYVEIVTSSPACLQPWHFLNMIVIL